MESILRAPTIKLNNGVEMPAMGLGTWKSKPGQVEESVKSAIKAGYRLIDCAFAYENEDEVGRALKEMFDSGVVKREELFIVDKLWCTFHSRPLVSKALDMSLKALGLKYVDLYLIHWPFGYKEGEGLFPMENGKIVTSDVDYLETWKGMEDLVKAGKAKAIGVSNFNSQQIDRILANCEIKPTINQVECHPYLNQEKLLNFCRARDITLMAYAPLGSPDRPWAKPGEPSLMDDPKIKEIADKYKKTPVHVLLRFQIDRGIIPVPKSVTPARIVDNFNLWDFKLSKEDMEKIKSFNRNHRFIDRALYPVTDHKYWPFNIEF